MSDLKILIVDNYDSFTYNLVQYFGEFGCEVVVFRNDAISAKEALAMKPNVVVISPGPKRPEDAGVSIDVIQLLGIENGIPLLGVCLGHQCIGHIFGANIIKAPRIMHGKISLVNHDNSGIFEGLNNPFEATRYHSLIVDESSLSGDIVVNARTEDNVVMGIRHKELPLFGVQFHPESHFTPLGKNLLYNLLKFG